MQSFKDNQQQVWNLSIDIPARKRIREDADFDLFAVVEEGEMEKLQDPEKLVAVLYSVCKDQVEKLGLNPDQFAARFTGDVLEEASTSLVKAIADFFPKRQRDVLTAVLAKAIEIREAENAAAMRKLQSILPPTLNESSASLPGLPDSTPNPAA